MFSIGRYDPRAESGAAAAKKTKEKKKRAAAEPALDRDENDVKAELVSSEHDGEVSKHGQPLKRRKKSAGDDDAGAGAIGKHDDDGGSGSDSSSMPYSSSDEDDSSSVDEAPSQPSTSSLKVIAPEQEIPAAGTILRRAGLTEEGLDDFDLDDSGQIYAATDGRKAAATSMTDQQRLYNAEISTALKLSQLPIREAAKIWKLSPFLVSNLERDGYENFFPIQSLVIPDVIASERHSQIRVRDICVSAPTGSGKTLSFVLPVLNALSNTIVRRLRALAVLPSRDLATQVYKVFKRYSEGSRLKVGLAIGQTDFEAEQKSLILGSAYGAGAANEDAEYAVLRHAFNSTNPRYAVEAYSRSPAYFERYSSNSSALSTPLGGRSAVDILVATPGRLIDHLEKTPGFTLQHLRFLIIDEADRLLNQSYQGWIQRVTHGATSSNIIGQDRWRSLYGASSEATDLQLSNDGTSFVIDPITWRKSMTDDRSSIGASISRPVPLRKMLFSATLTRDPQKLAALGLVNPKQFDAHHLDVKAGVANAGKDQQSDREERGVQQLLVPKQRYSVPESLTEHKLVCTAEQKPLVLLSLLLQHMTEASEKGNDRSMAVVFTSSLDSTHRLARLLQLLWNAAGYGPTGEIAEFSSALSQKQRSKLMRRCSYPPSEKQVKEGQHRVSVIICSDGMSRGMDLPNVGAVINYDVPRYAKTYVHRCGRTARAGKAGMAISVLKGGQVGEFVKMRRLIDDPGRVEEIGIKKNLVSGAIKVYQACVRSLRRIIDAEESGEMEASAPLTSGWVPEANDTNGSQGPSDDEADSGDKEGIKDVGDVDELLEQA